MGYSKQSQESSEQTSFPDWPGDDADAVNDMTLMTILQEEIMAPGFLGLPTLTDKVAHPAAA